MTKLSTPEMLKVVLTRLAQECIDPSDGDINKAALLVAVTRNLKGIFSAYEDYRKNTIK